jgi:large subunit ribosomal protein L21
MYAVIKAGGKQQRVKPGDVIEVELMHGDHGDGITFTPLLVVDDDGKAHVGKDLGKAQVKAKMVGQQKGEKVKVFKYRQKTGYKKTQGHRQMYTLVEIEDVSLGRRAASKKTASEEPEAKADDTAVEGADVEGAAPQASGEAAVVAEPEADSPEQAGQPEADAAAEAPPSEESEEQ